MYRMLGIIQSTGGDRMSGQWLWWSKWDTTFQGAGMAQACSTHVPSVVKASEVLGLKSTKPWEILGTFFNTQHSFQLGWSDSMLLGDLQGDGCHYSLIRGISVETVAAMRALSFCIYHLAWNLLCALYLSWVAWKFYCCQVVIFASAVCSDCLQ